jgi:hypothetical protein
MPSRGSRDEAPPPPATQDADQIHKLMQKKIAQLTKVVYHVNTTNEDHQSELAALKKQHREELARVSRDAAKRVKEIGDLQAATDGGLKKKLENLIAAHARDKATAQTKARECVNQALQKAHASHEAEMNQLRKVVKDLEERFRSAQNVFDATVEKLENGSNKKSEQLEKDLMKLQKLCDEKDQQLREGGEWRHKHDQLMSANEKLRGELEERERSGYAKGKHEAESNVEMRLGRLRAELKGEHEDAMAKQAKQLRSEKDEVLKLQEQRHTASMEELQANAKMDAEHASRLEKALKEANSELESLRADLKAKDDELERLREDALRQRGSASEELQRALDAQRVLEQANSALGKDNAAKSKALRDAADATDALQTRYDALARMTDSELSKRDGQLAEKDQQIDALRRERDALRDSHASSASDASVAEATIQKLRSELAELRKKSSAEVEALQNDLKASKQTLRDAQAQTEAQLSSLKDQIEAAKAKGKEALDAQRKRSAEREHKAQKEHKAQIEELQKQLREALEKNAQESALVQGSRQKLEKDLKDALQRCGAAEAESTRQQQLTQSLKSQVEELRRQLASEGREAQERLKRELQAVEASWAKRLQKELSELESRLTKEHSEAMARLQEAHGAALASLEQRRLDDLASTQAEADRVFADMKAKADAALSDATKRYEAAESALAKATADLERARAAIETASQDAHALVKVRDATIQELQDTIRDLEATLMDVRSDSQRTRDDLSQRLDKAEASSRQFSADLGEAKSEIDALRKAADVSAKAHGEELARAEAHRRQKLREAVKRAARVQALEGFLQAAKEAAVRRAERDALDADRALAKAACAAAQFALELNSTWQGNSENDKREFAERFAAMEKARDAALEDGRVALADLRRQHDDAMTALRREADERETAASAYLDSERRRLEDERDALLAKATSEADKRHATMVEAFESERRRTEGLLRDAQAKYDELQDKYTNRPSRPEDVERIATLERENEEALRDVARMKEELVYFKRELINREENFNSRFAAGGALGATVGVMNVLNTGKARTKKPKNGFR